ncbi:hypothetical protein TrCOL_g5182 [Triparma columacea]|uniref:EF-hand domain-containing protein n=1 Tax=Triparma columacea TaxID=722753 RepID=A0A9W7GNG2_9STRA|nr:hypothetical protein TrCOL_g5182 [Triparma columacea]
MEQKAREAWSEIDENGIGKVEVTEIPLLLENLGMPPAPSLEMELDRDGNGLVYRDDFVNWAVSSHEKSGELAGGGLEEGSTTSSNMLGLTPDELWKKVEKMAASAKNMTSSDIHEAAWKGDLELLKKYVYIDPSLSNSPDDSEWGGDYTPLHYAAYQGHVDICQFLIDDPMVDINRRTATGCTPLFLAAQQGMADVVRTLLHAGASPVIAEDEYFFTPIDVARQHKETVFSIFKSGEEWEYEKWRQAPRQLGRPALNNAKLTSFECLLPRLDDEEDDALKVREFKLKVVELPEGGIVDLLVVPRENWSGGEEEPVIIRNLVSGSSYAVYVAGVNGMGYGEYSEMSEVISTRVPKPKKKLKEGEEGGRRELKEVKELSATPDGPDPVEARKKKKKKKRSPAAEMKSKTLQPVDKGTKAGKKSATAEKAAKPSSLSLPTPTKMTPQQQQLNSDESSEMDFDALSNDASATASEGESVTATDGATEGPELDMPFGSWVTSADMSTAKMTKGNILVCELRKQDSTYARAQVKVIQGTAYKNVDGAFVPE